MEKRPFLFRFKFYYPLVEDTSTVDRYDLVLKLPQPNPSKTARTSSLLTFNINLHPCIISNKLYVLIIHMFQYFSH